MIDGVNFDPNHHIFTNPETGIRIFSVTDVLKVMGFVNIRFSDKAAMTRGRAVHLGIKLIEKGTIDWKTVDWIIEPYLIAYLKFKKATGCLTLMSEQIVWNPLLNYGGILDWFGVLNGSLGVCDYKTGSIQECTKYQVVGYQDCIDPASLKTLIPDDKVRCLPMKRWALELRDNGTYNLQNYSNPNDSRLFQSMVALAWEKINEGIFRWKELNHE